MTRTFSFVVCMSVLMLALIPAGQALAQDAAFMVLEKDGGKVWDGGGTVDLKGKNSITIKVSNPLTADHGFSIDSMKVQDVIKGGEIKEITVPVANIDQSVSDHKVYCQLHPKHGAASLKTTK